MNEGMSEREVKERRILDMLEQGLISSEEAYRLLQAIDKVEDNLENEEAKTEEEPQSASSRRREERQRHDEQQRRADHWEGKVEQAFSALERGTKRFGRLMEYVVDQVKALDWDAMFDLDWRDRLKVEKEWHGVWPEQGELTIIHHAGTVQVQGWHRKEYSILLNARVKEDRPLSAEQLIESLWKHEQETTIHRITMEAHRKVRANIQIYVPYDQLEHLHVETSNGKIDLENLHFRKAELATGNGAIRCDDLDGEKFIAHTSNGTIRIEDSFLDQLQCRSSNGSMHMEGSVKQGELETSNGSIHYEMTRAQGGELILQTKNGHIHVELPTESLGLEGVVQTKSGSIDIDVPSVVIRSEVRQGAQRTIHLERDLDASELLHLRCSTMNGSINID